LLPRHFAVDAEFSARFTGSGIFAASGRRQPGTMAFEFAEATLAQAFEQHPSN
jgi:hypothetical protein